jgi:site-specific recombinase XerD
MWSVERDVRQDAGVSRRHEDAVDVVVAAWLATIASPNTRAAYGRDLTVFRAWLRQHGHAGVAVRSDVIVAYREACTASDLSPGTVSRRLSTVASFYRYAVAQRAVADDPVPAARGRLPSPPAIEEPPAAPPVEGTGFRAEEIDAVWRAARRLGARPAALIGLMLHDGLKLHEAVAIDVAHVRVRSDPVRLVVVRRGVSVHLALDPRTGRAVRDLARGRSEGPLLRGRGGADGVRLTRFGADYLVKMVGEEAGLDEPLTANRLRRSHVAISTRRGIPLSEIRDRVGHRHVRSTARLLPDD